MIGGTICRRQSRPPSLPPSPSALLFPILNCQLGNLIHCDHRYQRAFLDFFEDELVRYGYDWKTVVIEYMLKGPEPLIFGGIGGCMSLFSQS